MVPGPPPPSPPPPPTTHPPHLPPPPSCASPGHGSIRESVSDDRRSGARLSRSTHLHGLPSPFFQSQHDLFALLCRLRLVPNLPSKFQYVIVPPARQPRIGQSGHWTKVKLKRANKKRWKLTGCVCVCSHSTINGASKNSCRSVGVWRGAYGHSSWHQLLSQRAPRSVHINWVHAEKKGGGNKIADAYYIK